MEDKKRQSMLKEMLEGRGFYIVLLLCLLTVGATGLVMAKDGEKLEQAQAELERQTQVLAPSVVPQEEEPPQQQESQQQVVQTTQEQTKNDVTEQQPEVEEEQQPADATPETSVQQTEVEQQPEAQSVMAQEQAIALRAPLAGAVQRA